jgi:hypothetical protein
MPSLDEQDLRDLMRNSTRDLHAPAGVGAQIVTRHRRRTARRRVLGVAMTGAAAGTAFGVIASGAVGPHATRGHTGGAVIRLTAAQQTLSRLSSVAAGSATPAGRYVVMKETQDGNIQRTSVLDSQTGDVWTFQQGPGVPSELPVARHDSPTTAQFAAMPTDPVALRALLIQQFQQQQKQANATLRQEARKAGVRDGQKKLIIKTAPKITDDDIVFDQATDMLWNPLVGPGLRSALFKVLENTPGVVVNSSARDADGRAAIEISRVDSYGEQVAVYENAATATVLEASFSATSESTANKTGWNGSDLYLSVTSTDTAPTASQYGS